MGDPDADDENPVLREEQDAQVKFTRFPAEKPGVLQIHCAYNF